MGLFGIFKRNKKNKEATPAKEVKAEVKPAVKEEPAVSAEVKPESVTINKPAPVAAKPAPVVNKPVPSKSAPVVNKSVPAAIKPAAKAEDGKVVIKAEYNRSYTAKLIQADDKLKKYYTEIKNELMRYKVKNRISWRYETFKTGRKLLARLAIRGKTLGVYLALDPSEYEDSEYKIDDVSSVAKNAEVPLLYKIKNDRRCRYSKELIADLMDDNGLEMGKLPLEDYVAAYPYESTQALLKRGLIKPVKRSKSGEAAVRGLIEIPEEKYEKVTAEVNLKEVVESVSVAEADEKIADEEVEAFVSVSERLSDKTKKDIVNIDALGRYFKAGEKVTVAEIAKRVPSVNKKATYIKVLARGSLDKALDIEADDFSPAAIKMIVLTGGTVTRTKSGN